MYRTLAEDGISVYVENETKERIKESKVAVVVFSDKYPESPQCLDEIVEIKKLLDEEEIDPFPIFYKLKNVNTLAQSVKELKGCFRTRLLQIEQEVRKTVKRENVNSILDTEALKSISSRPGLSNENISDPVFFTNVVTKVKELLEVKDKPKKSSSDTTSNQRFLPAFAPPDVATFTSTSSVKAEPVTPRVTKSEPTTTYDSLNTENPLVFGSSTSSVTFSTPISNSSTNEVEVNIYGSASAAANSIFEMGDTPQRTRVGRLIKPTQKVREMQLVRGRNNMGPGGRGICDPPL
ncbi:Toll/interleukin-1 receptor homology (TIR) domain-containing protein [Hirschfeldia incana]|nr:Toll/interleukin-1 receptor homology (TIR) domain-containing protein [Hirschfeldia incana]